MLLLFFSNLVVIFQPGENGGRIIVPNTSSTTSSSTKSPKPSIERAMLYKKYVNRLKAMNHSKSSNEIIEGLDSGNERETLNSNPENKIVKEYPPKEVKKIDKDKKSTNVGLIEDLQYPIKIERPEDSEENEEFLQYVRLFCYYFRIYY